MSITNPASKLLEVRSPSNSYWKLVTFVAAKAVDVRGVKVTSLLNQEPYEIWAGTSDGNLIIFDKSVCICADFVIAIDSFFQTCEIIQKIPIHNTRVRKMTMVSVDLHCVWIAVGTSIHIFSAKVTPYKKTIFHYVEISHLLQTKKDIIIPLTVPHPVTHMVLMPSKMLMWVSDTSGQVVIWDALVSTTISITFKRFN